MIDGSPNDILKESLNIMLGSASRDENMESVMLESLCSMVRSLQLIIEEVGTSHTVRSKGPAAQVERKTHCDW